MKFIRNDPSLKHRRRELRRNQTNAEKLFWMRLRNRQFYGMKFFLQYSTVQVPYILDFYCPELKLTIELDGGQHTYEDNREYDAERSAYLKSQGIDVMRFWNHEVLRDVDSVLAMDSARDNSPIPSYLKRGDGRREEDN